MINVRNDFPILNQAVGTKPLVYLDTAATAQKPRSVIKSITQFLELDNANVHRGVYELSRRSTIAYEQARSKIRRFINAEDDNSIVFTKNATEAINLVAHSFGNNLHQGDEIIISELEHHANIVPWQMLRDRKKIVLKIAPITDEGVIDLDAFKKLLNSKTKLVAVSYLSNALGTMQPIEDIVQESHKVGAHVLLDACQAAAHTPIDVQKLDCDFLVFSGHKLYGPNGIGVLYGKFELLNSMPPFLGGGDMIDTVTFDKTTYATAPRRFEAGTPPVAEAVGLGAAIDYLSTIGMENIVQHDKELLFYALEKMREIDGIQIYGKPQSSIISFGLVNAHAQDIATILDKMNVAVRAGHHCCMPLMARLGVSATTRTSFGIYTDKEDIDIFIEGLKTAQEMLG